jgi:hypothetical protein
MRETEASGWIVQMSPGTLMRSLRFAAVALGVGLVMTVGVARAQDDDDDDKSFEDKVIEGIMKGIGGTNMDNQGIDYRERSPLVVPPKLDLPPPEAAKTEIKDPNWPKDPDVAKRKARIAARKKDNKDPLEQSRILSPDELNKGKLASGSGTRGTPDTAVPGGEPGANAILSPSALGFDGSWTHVFGGNKAEAIPFKGEPTRDSLTQPPAGYQTPSPNFMYGTGPKESLNKEYDPAAGKYGE